MTLSNRDNTLAAIYYEKADYVPLTFESVCMTGTAVSSITDCPLVFYLRGFTHVDKRFG